MIFSQKLRHVVLYAIFIFSACFSALQTQAQDQRSDKFPPPDALTISIDSELSPTEETDPPLRLTPDKSQILTLDKNIKRIIIGNDAHINILLDTPKRLIIVPRMPGATHFTLIGENGEIIMQRHVIVASTNEKYVRIRKTCRNLPNCMPIRMFYCPGLCHEIAILSGDGTAMSGSISSGKNGGGGAGGSGGGSSGPAPAIVSNKAASASSGKK